MAQSYVALSFVFLAALDFATALEMRRASSVGHLETYAFSKAADTTTPNLCSQAALQIGPDRLVHNNLGGLGPQTGQKAMIFGDVAPMLERTVDLVITNTTFWSGQAGELTSQYGWGAITLMNGAGVDLKFKLVDRETGQAASVGPFYFTVYDSDRRKSKGDEEITFYGITSYNLSSSTGISVSTGDDSMTFTSKSKGYRNNSQPKNPLAMNEAQKIRTVTVLYPNVSEWNISFKALKGGYKSMFYAGASSLVCPQRAPCPTMTCPTGYQQRYQSYFKVCAQSPCSDSDADRDTCCLMENDFTSTFLDSELIRNNLGTTNIHPWQPAGTAKEGMVFSNIWACNGMFAELQINAVSDYTPAARWRNGLNGSYGNINLLGNSSVTLNFTFVSQETESRTQMPPFTMTFFDLDQLPGKCVESIDVSEFSQFNVTSDTTVNVAGSTFSSSAVGYLADNPSDQEEIDAATLKNAVTFNFPATSRFTVTFSVSPCEGAGRNILFSKPVMTCPGN